MDSENEKILTGGGNVVELKMENGKLRMENEE